MNVAWSTPPWCEGLPPPPLCDVPWMGNVTVAEDGNVQFCCYSPAIVGNVNQEPFAAIWNGPTMRRIRESLHRREFPAECRTTSCPVFRGDEHHFILERSRGPVRPGRHDGADPHAEARAGLVGTRLLRSKEEGRHGEPLAIELEVMATPAAPLRVDLFVALLSAAAAPRFLPDLGEIPIPFHAELEIPRSPSSRITLFDGLVPIDAPAGEHELIAALFLPNSNPSIASNCLLATRIALRILANAPVGSAPPSRSTART